MSLFTALKSYSMARQGWFLLTLFMLALLITAGYFQHVMLLAPCVMCIYERVATIGVGLAGLIGLIKPNNFLVRWLGLIVWAYSSIKGFLLAYKHVDLQLNPSPFNTCDIIPQFPSWAPLHEWLPGYFGATGDCSNISWQFLTLSMPQWLMVIFAGSSIVAILMILAQFARTKTQSPNFYNID